MLLGTDSVTGAIGGSNVHITGLPFTAANGKTVSGSFGHHYGFASTLDNPKWLVAATTSALTLYKSNNSGTTIKGDQIATGGNQNRMYITGAYQTAA